MCDYTGRHFGAHYPDAQCHDGFLWDLDSYEDGLLTSGGDIACPACNMNTWLEQVLDNVQNGPTDASPDSQPYVHFSNAIVSLMALHAPSAIASALVQMDITVPHWGPDQDINDEPDLDVCWPWVIEAPNLSAHDKTALVQGASPKEGFFLQDTLWIKHI